MKTDRKKSAKQRQIIQQKINRFSKLNEPPPLSGWVKAIRNSLGMTIRQLADRVGVSHGSIDQIEKRAREKATQILKGVQHTMRLEAQGTTEKEFQIEITRIVRELKESGGSRIWESEKIKQKEDKK